MESEDDVDRNKDCQAGRQAKSRNDSRFAYGFREQGAPLLESVCVFDGWIDQNASPLIMREFRDGCGPQCRVYEDVNKSLVEGKFPSSAEEGWPQQ